MAKDHQLPDGARRGRNDFGKLGYNALAESVQARYELFPEIDDVQKVSATAATA
jgi:hypothetical protein